MIHYIRGLIASFVLVISLLQTTKQPIKTLWIVSLIALLFTLAIIHFAPHAHGSQGYINDLDLTESVSSETLAYVHSQFVPTIATRPVVASKSYNVALGKVLASNNGIEGPEWECLYQLGMRESGWDNLITNKVSKAFGIAQSLPASKYDSFGDRNDPQTQILWMLSYIKNKYQTPCNAYQLQVKRMPHWY